MNPRVSSFVVSGSAARLSHIEIDQSFRQALPISVYSCSRPATLAVNQSACTRNRVDGVPVGQVGQGQCVERPITGSNPAPPLNCGVNGSYRAGALATHSGGTVAARIRASGDGSRDRGLSVARKNGTSGLIAALLLGRLALCSEVWGYVAAATGTKQNDLVTSHSPVTSIPYDSSLSRSGISP